MITASTANNIERSGDFQETNFTIKSSAKAFQILSSGLYSDKKMAIVRELMTNAADAHILAHNPNPFLVHLPNVMEPYLSIRDYGVGLSHENIMTVYTTYFESTKGSSNDFTGCLGLGSKSPFAYVDSFTVVSYFHGKKRTYNAFVDEVGCPSIAMMAEEETNEPNGLDVIVPAKQEDFYEFRNKLATIIRRFKITPKVVGCADFTPEKIEYTLMGNGWSVRKADGKAFAVMGNIGYPIDLSDTSLTPAQRTMLDLPIDISFEIGELDIAASREKLSFDKPTVANIKARLDVIAVEIAEEVDKQFVNCNTLWEARCLAHDIIKGPYSIFSKLLKKGTGITWQGQEVTHLPQSVVKARMWITKFEKSYRYDRKSSRPIDKELTNQIQPERNVQFFVDDVPRGSATRLSERIHATASTNPVIYLLKYSHDISQPGLWANPNPWVSNNAPAKWPSPQEQLQKFIEILGLDLTQIQYISQLPVPPRAPAAPRTVKGKAKVLRFNKDSYSRYAGHHWSDETVDFANGGVYVIIDRYKIFGVGSGCDDDARSFIGGFANNLTTLGIDLHKTPIYGVKKAHADKISKASNWTTLEDHCIAEAQTYLQSQNVSQKLADFRMLQRFLSVKSFDISGFVQNNVFDPSKAFGQLLSSFEIVSDDVTGSNWLEISDALDTLKTPVTNVSASLDLEALYTEVLKEYPMLNVIESYFNDEKRNIITDYILACDKK